MRRHGVDHQLRLPIFLLVSICFTSTLLPAKDPTDDTVGDKVDFSTQIAPLLRTHCIRCHEPENRQGDLSLSNSADLLANDGVIPGNPDQSLLLKLVRTEDGSKPSMPKQGPPLSKTETDLLARWIAEGAEWPKGIEIHSTRTSSDSWWAYQPLAPMPMTPPGASLTTRQKDQNHADPLHNAQLVDHYIRSKLSTRSLKGSPRADRQALIRRLHFDLHGLPPAPELVRAFINDPDPNAYAKLVDQLLRSPHYGERFTRHWLDLAHYADTHGFERDQRRDNAWRYRDYVIDSFNEDKPYNLFLQEQIAGDVLWPQNQASIIATGFLTAGPWDHVGHIETKSPKLRRAARSLDLDDMATQVMTSTLAMTVNCARCHDHKLDPISQREYYQLRAVFSAIKRDDRVISDSALSQYEQQKEAIISKRDTIDYAIGKLEGGGLNLADVVGGGNGFGTGTYRDGIDTRSAKVQTRDFGKLGNVVTNKFVASPFEFIDGVFVPEGHDGDAKIPVTSTGITITGIPTTSGDAWDMIRNGPVASQHSTELSGTDFTQGGHSLLGLHANAGITFDLKAIRSASNWNELRFQTKLGYFGADDGSFADAWIFLDGEKIFTQRQLKRSMGLQTVALRIPDSAHFLTLIATDGGNGYGMDQIGFGDPKLKPAIHNALAQGDHRELEILRQKRVSLTKRLEELGDPPRFYGPVTVATAPVVQVLERGDAESPTGTPLPPAAMSALKMLNPSLGSLTTPEAERRVALAKWITSDDNPLTARVIVNRIWQWHFGRGLVATSSDFGAGGELPSHPELLDWLANLLIQQQWSLKSLHRVILLSETYQQKSNFAPDNPACKVDADNRLLWRQNPRRIEAEAIRDSVLLVSGKLNRQRGGPGFEDFDYQDAYAPIYTYITADQPDLWRRSIYRYIVRTTPDRFLTTLDCPDPANLTARRETTTTPLQSLTLYNNEFMLRQAGYFAERIEQDFPRNTVQQVQRAFELALARSATERELQIATKLVQQQGLFLLCRSLMNSNEFVYVD